MCPKQRPPLHTNWQSQPVGGDPQAAAARPQKGEFAFIKRAVLTFSTLANNVSRGSWKWTVSNGCPAASVIQTCPLSAISCFLPSLCPGPTYGERKCTSIKAEKRLLCHVNASHLQDADDSGAFIHLFLISRPGVDCVFRRKRIRRCCRRKCNT